MQSMTGPDFSRPSPRSAPRSYPDPCGVARALNLVGERWALLVVRELLLGPKRFSDLRVGLASISPNVLSQRLEELTARGLVARRDVGPPVNGPVYELTDFGSTLEPVLLALATWGSRAIPPGPGELSTDALMLALRTTLRPDPHRPEETVLLHIETDAIAVQVGPRRMLAERRLSPALTQAVIITDAATLRAVVFAGEAVEVAIAEGRLRISGDGQVAHRFLTSFERPSLNGPVPTSEARASGATTPVNADRRRRVSPD